MHIICATYIGVTCFFNIVAPERGHKIFDHQIGGSQKYCRGTFGKSWPPNSKENGGPLIEVEGWISHYMEMEEYFHGHYDSIKEVCSSRMCNIVDTKIMFILVLTTELLIIICNKNVTT